MANKNYHHGDLKAELIRTGLKILDQEGYDGFSLRKVARSCEVSQTAPYRHFKDKDELITAITMEAMGAFNDCLEETVKNNPDNPKKQLIDMGIAYIKFFTERPEYLRLIFLNSFRDKINAYCNSYQISYEGKEPFQTFYETIVRYKEFCPEHPMSLEELLLYCWGLVHGISILIANNEVSFTTDSLALAKSLMEKGFEQM